MKKLVLYRKELELLDLVKKYISSNDLSGYISNVRDAIPDLFYESNFNLKSEFIELISVERLSKIRTLLDFLKMISWSTATEFSANGTLRGTKELAQDISALSDLMKKELNLRSQFTVFYSWQCDSKSTYNRNFIEKT